METITVIPKSNKAKNRLCNTMGGDPICIIEQNKGNSLFLRSSNGKYFFWINVQNDENWTLK